MGREIWGQTGRSPVLQTMREEKWGTSRLSLRFPYVSIILFLLVQATVNYVRAEPTVIGLDLTKENVFCVFNQG